MRLFVGQILFAAAIIGIVMMVKHVGGYPEYVLPSGSTIVAYVGAHWMDLARFGAYTFLYACFGLMIALVVASVTAVATMRSKRSTEGALAFGIAWQSYPIVALAPLLFVMFGDGQLTRIIIISSFAYFPAFLTFLAVGSRRVEALENFFEQVEQWPRGGRFLIRLNHSAKTVESAIIGSSALALVGAVVAEFLGANYGIGYLIRTGQYSHHTEIMVAAIITIAFFGAFYFAAIQGTVRTVLPGAQR